MGRGSGIRQGSHLAAPRGICRLALGPLVLDQERFQVKRPWVPLESMIAYDQYIGLGTRRFDEGTQDLIQLHQQLGHGPFHVS